MAARSFTRFVVAALLTATVHAPLVLLAITSREPPEPAPTARERRVLYPPITLQRDLPCAREVTLVFEHPGTRPRLAPPPPGRQYCDDQLAELQLAYF